MTGEERLRLAWSKGTLRMEPPCPTCGEHVLPTGIITETGIESVGYGDHIVPIARSVQLTCGHSMPAQFTLHCDDWKLPPTLDPLWNPVERLD